MNKNLKVEFITPQETLDLRTRILRPGQPIESCQYPGDHDKTSIHLGIRMDTNGKMQIVCNGTLLQETHKNWPEAKLPYRFRGMATDTQFQRQGLGKALLKFAMEELKRRNCDLLWFNARTSAIGFYEKLGFATIGEIFDIPGAGPHRVMYKWL